MAVDSGDVISTGGTDLTNKICLIFFFNLLLNFTFTPCNSAICLKSIGILFTGFLIDFKIHFNRKYF